MTTTEQNLLVVYESEICTLNQAAFHIRQGSYQSRISMKYLINKMFIRVTSYMVDNNR